MEKNQFLTVDANRYTTFDEECILCCCLRAIAMNQYIDCVQCALCTMDVSVSDLLYIYVHISDLRWKLTKGQLSGVSLCLGLSICACVCMCVFVSERVRYAV